MALEFILLIIVCIRSDPESEFGLVINISTLLKLFREDGSIIDIPDFVHPGILLERKEDSKLLFEAIEKLNQYQKQAYILKNITDLSYKEIADVMDKTTSSIESLIFRAKRNLKKELIKKMDNKK